ncbi:MAG: metabolite traffic protein EboE [Rhodopirellula sp. JB055]|uniref:metabolite traffic protein EboE n=1 Tax=Rhodopirellula sp. JB055 TaxID=3342846 RepID=UPI00370B7154
MTSSPNGFPDVTAVIEKSNAGLDADGANRADRAHDSDSSIRWTVGYCTNIHAGPDVQGVKENLESISAEVRRRILDSQYSDENGSPKVQTGKNFATIVSTAPPLGIGLWLSAEATADLRRNGLEPLTAAMKKARLLAYTFNGFPHDNFHQNVVKHAVYSPTWWEDARIGYTRDLAKILAEILPADTNLGTISTLPIGWPQNTDEEGNRVQVSDDQLHHAGTNLRRMAEDLRRLEDRTGKRIVLAIEPEPGCILDTAAKVIEWFEKQLPDATHRRYIGVCHDVCHSAVMGESQHDVLAAYAKAGIVVGKVQVSSAIVVDWSRIADTDREATLTQLRSFAEDRYLHQTGRVTASGKFVLEEDLPAVLAEMEANPGRFAGDKRWMIHFHVPIFAEQFGHLETTRGDVLDTLKSLVELTDPAKRRQPLQFTGHLEVETYAWSVLPESAGRSDLAGDIASELIWLHDVLSEC